MFSRARSLAALPNTLDTSRLDRLSEPTHEVLSDLIHDCSPDSSTRTATASALILSLWQLRGRALSEHVPSLILLNAGEAAPDPVDDFTSAFIHDQAAKRPEKAHDRLGLPIDPEQAPRIMAQAVIERRKLGRGPGSDLLDHRAAQAHEERYHDARRAAFGNGWARPYAEAWTELAGLLTDDEDRLIARLSEGPDRAAFRHDVLEDPDKIRIPEGIGRNLQMVRKSICISGSLTEDLWPEKLVRGIIELGLPVLFVPHTASEPLTISNPPALEVLPTLWRDAAATRAKTNLMLPPVDWFEPHAKDARRRLHLLPGSGTYEFAVLQALHQLGDVCDQIAHFAANTTTASRKHVSALFWDLHTRAFRGITLGVDALAWHCLGFDPGCPREKALKALKDLRTKGPMSRSDILRSAHLKKEQRDVLLDRLAAEDLVRIDGKMVTATTFEEFVKSLHSRSDLPEPDNYRALIADTTGDATDEASV